jgi:hypothetical protein
MSGFYNGIGNLPNVPSLRNCQPDLRKIGQDIYDFWNMPPMKRQVWKKRVIAVEIKPDHMYSPQEVAAVLSVSYDTATRIMSRMKRVANLAQPRARKRLLRIKGSDLRAYIQDKLEG